jgi:hypothetical protein
MSLSVTIEGTAEMKASLARIGADAQAKVAAALFQEAEIVMAESKERYVPVDHGILRSSGFVLPPKIEDGDVTVTLGFGGNAKAYAIAVHEHLSDYSPRSWKKAEASGRGVKFSPSGAGPKYLERPLMETAKYLAQHLADRLRAVLR